jgi:aryl-phospho-beta-D-glucosidase BglC (GH1 family)
MPATGGMDVGGQGGEGGAAPAPATVVERNGHLHIDGTHLVNEEGEPVQLRGVSSMWLNWENDGYALTLSGLQFMRDNWGLQVIRAAMGVDADGGYADSGKVAMVNQVNTIVENAEQAGVYVIVDFHSHNALDLLPEAIEFFSDISARYGHLPNLILEPFNEPLGVSWATQLRPYHEAVLTAIRDNDPDGIPNVAILGTPNWCQDVDDVVGQRLADPNVMYTVHFYSCDHGTSFLSRAKTAVAAGIPVFITEWGATKADGGIDGTPVCGTPQADAWLDWAAQEHVGWAAWKLDNCLHEFTTNGVEDTSCFFKANTSTNPPWADSDLNGHAPYVISRMGCQ